MKRFLYLAVFISSLFAETINISPVDCEVVQSIKDSTIMTFQQLKDKMRISENLVT